MKFIEQQVHLKGLRTDNGQQKIISQFAISFSISGDQGTPFLGKITKSENVKINQCLISSRIKGGKIHQHRIKKKKRRG